MNLALVPSCRSQKQSYMTISADVQQQAVHGTRVLLLDWGEKLFTRVSTVSLFIEKKKKSRNIKKEKERNN